MRIIKIEIPLKFEVSSINCYLIKNDPITIIDPGPYSEFHLNFLEENLKKEKLILQDIKRILLTHGHTDHAGIAGYLQEKFNSEVFIHKNDEEKITKTIEEKLEKRRKYYAKLLLEDGFPESIVSYLINFVGEFYKYVFKADNVNYIDNNSEIEFENFKLQVLHTPGHTGGHVVFINSNEKVIFSGDVLLDKIFVTPLLEFDDKGNRRKNLYNLILTLKKIREFLNFNWYVAHGNNSFDKETQIYEVENKINLSLKKLKKEFNKNLTIYKNFQNFYKNIEKEKLLFYVSYFYGLIDFLEK